MNNSTKEIYRSHHLNNRPEGFSIMESERALLLKDSIGVGKKILDIGCRDGNLTKHFVLGNDILGVDIDDLSLLKAKNNLNIETLNIDLNGDWLEIGDKKFDVVVAGEILEHLFYPEAVLKKVKDYLLDGGLFIGSVPNAFSLKNKLRYLRSSKKFTPLSDPTHINHFSFNELKNLLNKHFSKVEVVGLGRFQNLSRFFPSLFAFDLFFICRK